MPLTESCAQPESPLCAALSSALSQALAEAAPTAIWLAFSGGVDSQLLATLLAGWQRDHPQIPCYLLHVHHGLSDDAEQWVQHCQASAEQLGLPLTVHRVELQLGPRISVEAAARHARYQAFLSHIDPQHVLLTGHHLDDQAETLLLALKRGSGPKGLSAMAPSQPFGAGRLMRPWLGLPRRAIEQAAAAMALSHIEDHSNADLRFDRNFLRHRILPQLEARWPGVKTSLARSAVLCAEQQSLCDELAATDLARCQLPADGLSLARSAELSVLRRNNLVRYWLAQQGALMPSRLQLAQIERIWQARADSQPQVDWAGWSVRRYLDGLYLLSAEPALPCEDEPWQTQCLANGECWRLQSASAGPRLQPPAEQQRLTVRYGLPGTTRLRPAGRSGSRPLKKLWQEYRVPPWLRSQVAMLCYDDKVVAALGYWLEQDALCQEGPGVIPQRQDEMS
ncbi:tRNA lysidine(34) synthetase TilS [Ferrimonas pelagia]|uniref:tRNA(Ile)-lysidine synthase n=1 Tax=Ferrimonas pelagia TaxID=1177826 RepID=A0ABP9EIW8_9GAMM